MLKKLLVVVATLVASIGFAFAQVDVNKADQAALDGIKGIGPSISKKILDERKKGGDFKDWDDLEKRVKGIGAKNGAKMSAAGLTVNNQSLTGSPAVPAAARSKAKDKDAKPAAAAPATSAAPATLAAPAAKTSNGPAAARMPAASAATPAATRATPAAPATAATGATPATPATAATPAKK